MPIEFSVPFRPPGRCPVCADELPSDVETFRVPEPVLRAWSVRQHPDGDERVFRGAVDDATRKLLRVFCLLIMWETTNKEESPCFVV